MFLNYAKYYIMRFSRSDSCIMFPYNLDRNALVEDDVIKDLAYTSCRIYASLNIVITLLDVS